MNPLQQYNFVPTTVEGNQFISFRQPAYYMTDYRNSSDLYSYLIHDVTGKGVTTGHQLRQYLQDHGTEITDNFFRTTASQFLNMTTPGAPNICTGSQQSDIYSGGRPLVNNGGVQQGFNGDCTIAGQQCMMYWDNTPLPQQGPHCMQPPANINPYLLLR
jgi:hypothetical protein